MPSPSLHCLSCKSSDITFFIGLDEETGLRLGKTLLNDHCGYFLALSTLCVSQCGVAAREKEGSMRVLPRAGLSSGVSQSQTRVKPSVSVWAGNFQSSEVG